MQYTTYTFKVKLGSPPLEHNELNERLVPSRDTIKGTTHVIW